MKKRIDSKLTPAEQHMIRDWLSKNQPKVQHPPFPVEDNQKMHIKDKQ